MLNFKSAISLFRTSDVVLASGSDSTPRALYSVVDKVVNILNLYHKMDPLSYI